jgi:hydrogenase maturation protein HypF
MASLHLHIEGQVQGVGFRPHVYHLAKARGLLGWVSNGADGVHIEVQGSRQNIADFTQELLSNPPARSIITGHRTAWLAKTETNFSDFSIRESSAPGKATVMLTPDIALCETCREELHRPGWRQGYAFTTCTHCGPRYSIMEQLPYDRHTTTMRTFAMCSACRQEYDNPHDRRHFSQTNSCPQCAIELTVTDAAGQTQATEAASWVAFVQHQLAAGRIVAVKGIGGYLLMADATQEAAIATLRLRKQRPAKPFALLYPHLNALRRDAAVSAQAEAALCSPVAPIVLLPLLSNPASGLRAEAIAPGLRHIGAMLPYAPLLELLMQGLEHPIVATSGNISGSPIFFQDGEAAARLNTIADFFLMHNREIVVPQDDSVWQFAPLSGRRTVLRRSRGMAPAFLPNTLPPPPAATLAMGADLKSAFAFAHEQNLFVSQYLGDLEDYETQKNFQRTLNGLLRVLQEQPARVLIDTHPAYHSSLLGLQLGKRWNCPVEGVQHHCAHFAAVLAENQLLEETEPVLGVVWDGTGWGDDGHLWGGEFFVYNRGRIERVHHLPYFDHWLGDKASREPRLSALGLCKNNPQADALLRDKFSAEEWKIYKQLAHQPHALQTSSMGRVFDAAAAILGVCDRASYEGEAAMKLEALARGAYANTVPAPQNFNLNETMTQMVSDVLAGAPREQLAFQFHTALANWVWHVAETFCVTKIAFSGGVFQNALLVDLLGRQPHGGYTLYWHRQLSPNDECIAFGQLAWQALQREGKANARTAAAIHTVNT